MDLVDVSRFLSAVGIPAGFAFALLLLIWQLIKHIAPYARDLYDRHTTLVQTLERTLHDQTKTAELQLDQLQKLSDHTEDMLITRKVAIEAVQLLDKICEKIELDADKELDSMRRDLKEPDEPGHKG